MITVVYIVTIAIALATVVALVIAAFARKPRVSRFFASLYLWFSIFCIVATISFPMIFLLYPPYAF